MNRLWRLTSAFFIVMLLGACTGGAGEGGGTVEQTPTSVPPTSTPTSIPTPTPEVGNRVRISSIKLNAPLVLQKVETDGGIPAPVNNDSVEVVEFGDLMPKFGGLPGRGNTVMIGNYDSGTTSCNQGKTPPPCLAVFKSLHEVTKGDKVEVVWEGTTIQYEVKAICNVPANKLPIEVYATTSEERISFFTYGGVFDKKTFQYSHWLIVIAQKPESQATSCPAGTSDGPPKGDVSKGGSS